MSWDSKLFQRHLATRRFGREYLWFEEIDSTNRWLAENAAQFTMSGALVIADHQTAGRGRYRRTWCDVSGASLLFSIMLRFPEQIRGEGFIGLLPAMAIADYLRNSYRLGKRVELKWPNDVLINGKKVAGILGQRAAIGEQTIVIVGVGINVSAIPSNLPDIIRSHATSIADEICETLQREPLLAAILERWEELFDTLLSERIEMIRTTWEHLGPAQGVKLTRSEGNDVFTGYYAGLGSDGQLRMANDKGIIREFHSGDMSA